MLHILYTYVCNYELHNLMPHTVYVNVPPRVEYTLSDLEKSLKPIFDSMVKWDNSYNSNLQKRFVIFRCIFYLEDIESHLSYNCQGYSKSPLPLAHIKLALFSYELRSLLSAPHARKPTPTGFWFSCSFINNFLLFFSYFSLIFLLLQTPFLPENPLHGILLFIF